MTTNEKQLQTVTYITGGVLLALAIVAFILSYSALLALARTWGFGKLSFLWPLLLDAAMVVFSLVIFWKSLKGEPAKKVWMLAISFSLMATFFNALHAPLSDASNWAALSNWLGYVIWGLAPIALLLVFETFMDVVKSSARRQVMVLTLDDLKHHKHALSGELEALQGKIDGLAEKRRQIEDDISELRRARVELTPDDDQSQNYKITARREQLREMLPQELTQQELADAVGVSLSTLRRDLDALGVLNGKGSHTGRF
jgi:FtsZ-binding cell division protein ZapB